VATRVAAQYNGTNQTLTGVGVLNHGTSLFSRSYVFAYIGLLLFDGQTFEVRSNPNANFKRVLANMAADITRTRNMTEIDNAAFPASPPDAANSAILRDTARQLVTEELDKDIAAYFRTDEQ